MVARRPAAIATIAVAALAAGAARAAADALVYRCGPNICKAAPDGTGKQRLTTDGKPGGPLYSWLSASADGSRLAVVNATYAYVLDGRGRRLTGKLPRGGIGVIAEIAPSGAQVATVDLLPEITPAPVGSPPGTPGLSGFVPYMFVMNADGSAREATARSVIDIGWFGQRLVRTDKSDADPFPYGICVLATNTDFQCGSDAARDPTQDLFNPAFSSDGTLVAVVKSPSTTIGAGAIVIYDVATAALCASSSPARTPSRRGRPTESGSPSSVAATSTSRMPPGAPRERRVLKGGQQPNWTSAAACKPRRPRVRVRVLRRVALVTACAPQPGRLTVTLLRAGRRVARRTVTAATGGRVTVRLRRPAGASAGELTRARSSRGNASRRAARTDLHLETAGLTIRASAMSLKAARVPVPMRAKINGAELCVDTIGDPAHPAVLLIMGGAGSMDRWEEPFCERLAAAGRYVIRYDHRDTGGSTTYPPGSPGYTGDDLVADALGILDRLGVERAHLVGISMGGGIVQRIAVDHPERVLSLTLISTSPAGSGGDFPELPPMSEELRRVFGDDEKPAEPDWSDREAAIAFLLEGERPYAGSRGVDEEAMRALLGRVYDRSTSLPSANNHFILEGSDMARARLAEITAPTLVIHGADDPLFPPAHGEALAREIAGAKLLVIDGLGHEFPPSAWDEVLPALIAVTG